MDRCALFSALLFCILQSTFAYEEELRFVTGLTEEGFPKLAEKILFRTLEKYPDAESEAPELRVRILIASRKFDQAAEQISTVRNPEPLWLFLAESAAGDLAVQAYQNYFNTAEHPDNLAVFKYGALLEERGDDAAAIRLYEKVDARPVKSRLAALLVESDPDRALKLAEDVQLGGLDLWFGSAVVSWAQVMIGKGEWDETRTVLEGQLELLKQLSDSVDASVAPLAGARYWLGVCYEHAGRNADALTQFYNVYAKYGNSAWGPQAQSKAQALIDDFEAEGKTVNIDLGANLAKMEESTFRVARRLFFDRQYAEAVLAYIAALNDYPEGSESITALRELALCAIQLDDPLMAETVGFYLAERFSDEPQAGDALLAAGKAALDSKRDELAWMLYDLFIENFFSHPRAPAVLYSLSGLRKNEGYLFQLLENYPDSTYYARALGRLAWNAYQAKDYKSAAERFAPYVETETNPQKRIRARFAFGDSYRQLEWWGAGSACFQTLEKQMADAASGFGVSAETLTFNQAFWEKSIYYQAVCLKELGETDEAIACFDRFLSTFPRSELAEQVRFSKAKTLVEAERYAEALPALDGLDGEFAEPVCYYRGIAQYETGAYEASFQTLEKLLTDWPVSAFTYEAMFVQGRAFNAAGRNDDAIRVLGEIMNFATDDELMHRASLELGRAQNDPAEKLASFQRVALLADPEKNADLIAQALFESLPLYLELDRPADLIADADRLTAEFSSFGKTAEIALLKTRAEQIQKELTADNADGNGSKEGSRRLK
ncbi:tetratricopeptide repeat protein [Tichowtungia aerotolerans]|uniref:Tetratricopeptide repeat protein n=1 Tax=Tichowtungia aerotolerans TaxID=2697043 RepID=A0A6P1M7B5_9BACT|nr:tetratricopeptide repeat protein [Tichowtungia aerotolerans]QHI68933.1 tetratricopeptide repeat protein [Tichowtungia aerotolerans]